MAKVVCSEALCGWSTAACRCWAARASPHETPVARIFRDIRAFRIYDGPCEVHRFSLGKKLVAGRDPARGATGRAR